jgi:hypothetical protein
MKSRELFSDGLNSFWHVFFGLLSIRFLVIIPIFVIYQLINIYDKNLFVDLAEFFIGFFSIILLTNTLFAQKETTIWTRPIEYDDPDGEIVADDLGDSWHWKLAGVGLELAPAPDKSQA